MATFGLAVALMLVFEGLLPFVARIIPAHRRPERRSDPFLRSGFDRVRRGLVPAARVSVLSAD
jgi:hypothetical protein